MSKRIYFYVKGLNLRQMCLFFSFDAILDDFGDDFGPDAHVRPEIELASVRIVKCPKNEQLPNFVSRADFAIYALNLQFMNS